MLSLSAAWLTCASCPRIVTTIEMPMLLPMLRIEAEHRRAFVAVARRERRERDRGQRHENETETHALEDAGVDDLRDADFAP